MGLRAFIEKRALTPTSPRSRWETDFPGAFSRTFSGKTVGQRNARNLVAVYACQSLIADGIASLPVDHFRKVQGRREHMENSPAWLDRPNPYQTRFDFWHRAIVSLLSDGNLFIATIRGEGGRILALYVLHPEEVTIDDSAGDMGEPFYWVGGERFGRNDILHIPAFSVPGEARGLSPIEVAREAVGMGLSVEEFGARFFAQGTTMAGVIEHPGKPTNGEAKLLKAMFRKTHAGVKNSHAVGVLTGGATFKPISIRPDQAQFLETRRFQKAEIALLYRVPAYMVDPSVTSTWGTGIEEQNKFFIDQTLMPWITRIEAAFNTFLLPRPQYIKFNVDARMRAKTVDRFTAYKTAIDSGVMNIDEARALEDMEPIPGGKGKVHYRPLNMAPLGTPVQPKKQNIERPADDDGTDSEDSADE